MNIGGTKIVEIAKYNFFFFYIFSFLKQIFVAILFAKNFFLTFSSPAVSGRIHIFL